MIYVFICSKTTADTVVPAQTYSQADFNRKVANAFQAQTGGHLTAGDLKLRPIAAAVPNHLLCDGSEVSRTQFPELFALLGESAGAGDGVSTFNLPNYLGTALAVAPTAPDQTIGSTVSTGNEVTEPSGSGQTGGTAGGNVVSGGA